MQEQHAVLTGFSIMQISNSMIYTPISMMQVLRKIPTGIHRLAWLAERSRSEPALTSSFLPKFLREKSWIILTSVLGSTVPVFCKSKDKRSWCSTWRRACVKADVKCGVVYHGGGYNDNVECLNLDIPHLRSLRVRDNDDEEESSKRQRRAGRREKVVSKSDCWQKIQHLDLLPGYLNCNP